MRRRNFFKTLGTALAGFSILPAATTYNRLWKAVREESMVFHQRDYAGAWQFYFIDEPGRFDELILKNVTPVDPWTRFTSGGVWRRNGDVLYATS